MSLEQQTRAMTDKQQRVAELAVLGLTNQEMSDHLGVSVNTVKRHMSNLMLKFNVVNRVQLAVVLDRIDPVKQESADPISEY